MILSPRRAILALSLTLPIAILMSLGGPVAAQSAAPPVTESAPPNVEQAPPILLEASFGVDPKLDSRLRTVTRATREGGEYSAAGEARTRGLTLVDGRVRVVVEGKGAGSGTAASAVEAAGGEVEAEYASLAQALVPMSRLGEVARDDGVLLVRAPADFRTDAVVSEGVRTSNAGAFQAVGVLGTGVKVGIVDGGFAGYRARQAGGDLPASVTPVDFCAGELERGTDHGTGVAEIVYDEAPGAQLFLICINSEVTLGRAKDYAKANGISIVNASLSFYNTSRGDGSGEPGTPDAIVADARANGILWVNSAGNSAQRHWSGSFGDPDNDGFLNFTAGDEGNSVAVPAGVVVCVYLKWDSWPRTSQDFDLIVTDSASGTLIAASTTRQTGAQRPTESACFTNVSDTGQVAAIFIRRVSGTANPRLDLFIAPQAPDQVGVFAIQYVVPEGSVTEPASSPNALSAGAVCWQTNGLESFSARGPTIDGRIKPDIAGQDSVTTATFGPFTACGRSGFAGTSASAPHVAGAAAVLKQVNPSAGPAELQSLLERRAVDLGPPGKDNAFGAGVLSLGPPPPAPRGDLAITAASSPSPVRAGGSLTIVDTVVNNGPGTALASRVAHKLPPEVTSAAASTSAGTCTFESAVARGKPLGRVLCQLGDLAPGSRATVTITLTAPSAETLAGTAKVKQAPSNEVDPNPSNNAVGLSTAVTP